MVLKQWTNAVIGVIDKSWNALTPSGRQLTARAVFAAAMRIRPVSPATGSGAV